MQFLPGETYHIYNQGNNQISIFYDSNDYLLFLKKMRKALSPHCSILAWCLMPNHFHWLVQIKTTYSITYNQDQRSKKLNQLNNDIGILLSSYTQSLNKRMGKSGSLFRKRTKAKLLSENSQTKNNYGINCFLYIHQNPLKAGLVNKIEGWEYSSFRDYAGLRKGSLCNMGLAKDLFKLPKNSGEFYNISKQTIPDHILRNLY